MTQPMLDLRDRGISRSGVLAALVAVVLFVVFLVLPISMSRTIEIAGKILPAREWLLVKDQEGGVVTVFGDYLHGRVESYSVVSIIRGDAFQFAWHPSLTHHDLVTEGDTLGRITSHELDRELYRLSGELEVAECTLAIVRSGEKAPIAREAERSLALARERSEIQASLFKRQDSLYKRNLIAVESYELARSAARLSDVEVAVAEARLLTVTTGSKPEQISMIESRIAGLEKELRALTDHMGSFTIVSPFAGVLFSSAGTDTLCTVEDTARVVLLPVPVEYLTRVAPGQLVTMHMVRHADICSGIVVRVDPRIRTIAGRQVVMATATLNQTAMALPSRLVVAGWIETDRVSPARYVQYWISDFVNEVIGGATGI